MALTISILATGTFIFEDDGTPFNGTAQIRQASNNAIVLTLTYPLDSLTLVAGATDVTFNFNLFDSLLASALIVGDFANSGARPTAINIAQLESAAAMTFVANTFIRELGTDAGSDIIAANILLSGSTGIGTAGNALETETAQMQAETLTGGINIVNFGALTIGDATAEIGGLSVATSGNLRLVNFGSIIIAETGASSSIQGGSTSGDVILDARGTSAAIISTVNSDAITAPTGNIVLKATGNITFGNGGTNFDNDIRAKGNITVNAGGYFYVDGFSDVVAGDFSGSGSLAITAAQGIFILDSTGTDGSIAASDNVTLNVGSGGTLTSSAVSSQAILSSNGDVNASADRIEIASDSGITAASGSVTLRPTTEGRRVNLGSVTELAGALSLSDAELDRVFTTMLVLGSLESGTVLVSANLSPANATNLTIESGADLVVGAGVQIQSGGTVTLRAAENLVLAAGSGIQAVGGITAFVDFGNPNPGTGGEAIVAAGFATSLTLIGNVDNDVLTSGLANDTLDGRGGADTMTGRLGNDTYIVDNAGDQTVESVGQGTDTIRSSINRTLAANIEQLVLLGGGNLNGTGNTLDNRLVGNTGNNTLNGAAGFDDLLGGNGNDNLVGGAGNDELFGGNGNDQLSGGADADRLLGNTGNDVMNGGTGADSFVFNTAFNAATNVDTIGDFSIADDTIELENAIFTALTVTGALAAAAFRVNATGLAQDDSDRIIYETDTGNLFYDSNGNAAGGRVLFATLDPGLALTRLDFLVI